LLEDDSLGGGGSRGSGRVKVEMLRLAWRGRSFYVSGAEEKELVADADLASLQKTVQEDEFTGKLTEE
jgi:CRISPR-associated protein Csm3